VPGRVSVPAILVLVLAKGSTVSVLATHLFIPHHMDVGCTEAYVLLCRGVAHGPRQQVPDQQLDAGQVLAGCCSSQVITQHQSWGQSDDHIGKQHVASGLHVCHQHKPDLCLTGTVRKLRTSTAATTKLWPWQGSANQMRLDRERETVRCFRVHCVYQTTSRCSASAHC